MIEIAPAAGVSGSGACSPAPLVPPSPRIASHAQCSTQTVPSASSLSNVNKSASPPRPFTRIPASAGYLKTGHRIRLAGLSLMRHYGHRHTMVTTATFRRPIYSLRAVAPRVQPILDGLRKRYPGLGYLWTVGRSQAGHLHLHFLFGVPFDASIGTVWATARRDGITPMELRAALNPAAQQFWKALARVGRPHGVGRLHVAPVLRYPDDVARYLETNYIEYQLNRRLVDAGCHSWGMSRGVPRPPANNEFTLLTPGNARHRRRIAEVAMRDHGIENVDQAISRMGPRWHWHLSREAYAGEPTPSGRRYSGRLRAMARALEVSSS